jgi:transporter family-2 protein
MNAQAHSDYLPIVTLMFVSGLGIPVFAAFNGALGQQLGGPVAASAVSFAIALVFALILLALVGFPSRAAFTFERPYIWFGALFVLFYGIAVSFAVPRIGVGNAVFFVLLGQLVAAAAIDHFGWWGAMHAPLTLRRALGIAAMGLGVYLAKKPV